jgi:hypothetical protein
VRAAIIVAGAATALALAAVLPAPAWALTVTGPRAVFGQGDYVVKLASGDPTGTVTLRRDGIAVANAVASAGGTVRFRAVALPGLGWHSLRASVDSSEAVVSLPLAVRVYARPKAPLLYTWTRGSLTARKLRLRVKVSSQTYYVAVFVNGKLIRKQAVTPNKVNDLGIVAMPSNRNSLLLRAGNAAGAVTASWRFKKFAYPGKWKTCIVVDKSELRLYWIVNDQMVKWYKCACGRPSLPTPNAIWRVGIKEHMDPSGAFGPRRMRLFRFNGSGYDYTGYGIHGTNNPPSIGTYASHGCIRMYPADVIELFPQVPLYTLVKTQE